MQKHRSRGGIFLFYLLIILCSGCRDSALTPTRSISPSTEPVVSSPLTSPSGGSQSSPLAIPQQGDWPQGQILYHSDFIGIFQIYYVANNQSPIMLTDGSGAANDATWSPNGDQIAFAAYTDQATMEIFVMQADGSQKRKVMSQQSRLNWRPDWSPNGNHLLFQSNRDGNFEIYRVEIDGSNLTNLSNNSANDSDPDWSPDGERIAFISDRTGSRGLYTMDMNGENIAMLLDGSWLCTSPRWSPNGEQIAFASEKDGTWEIFVVDADGSNPQQVTDRTGDNVMPAWVGNDSLLFSGFVGDVQWEIFQINTDGSGMQKITNTPSSERYPIWRP